MGVVVPLRSPRDARSDAPPAVSDAELVERAKRGSDDAKTHLYRRHAPMIIGLSHRVLGRPSEVDDLVQDTFLQAFASLPRLQDGQAFASWIATICVRGARRRIRRAMLRRRLGLGGGEALDPELLVSNDASPEVRSELRALYAVVEELPPDARIALVLRRVEGLTVPEISERLGLSSATVKRRIQAGEVLLAGRLGRGRQS